MVLLRGFTVGLPEPSFLETLQSSRLLITLHVPIESWPGYPHITNIAAGEICRNASLAGLLGAHCWEVSVRRWDAETAKIFVRHYLRAEQLMGIAI